MEGEVEQQISPTPPLYLYLYAFFSLCLTKGLTMSRSVLNVLDTIMGTGFALLWSKILESSLWVTETKETRLVWITLLALKDSKGIVQSSVIGLADRAKVSLDECREALRVLTSPDEHDTSGVKNGIRLEVIQGGWQIVNHELYRFSTEAKREYWKEQKRKQRAVKGGPLPGEATFCKTGEMPHEYR